MWKVLYIVGGLVAAALGGMVLVFSLGQRSASYVLVLNLLDAGGRPLPAQPVVVWDRSAGPREYRLNDAGQLTLELSESFSASALGSRRPAAFAIRLAFPEISPLYYWFEVARSGPLPFYQVFNDYYSYGANQWVGDFDAAGFVRRTMPAADNQTSAAVPPRGGQVLRWQAAATLKAAGKTPDGRSRYHLALTMQQSGVEVVEAR